MIRRLLVASAAALTAGTAATLALTAALDITWDPEMAVAVAIAAVFIPQYLLVALVITRKGRP